MSHVPRYLRFEQKLASGWTPPPRKNGGIPAALRDQIIGRDSTCCYLCGLDCRPNEIHVDHVIPKSRGGTDDPSNLKVSCSACNVRKSNKLKSDPPRIGIQVERRAEPVSGFVRQPHQILVSKEQRR